MDKDVAAALEDAPQIHGCLANQMILQTRVGMEVAVLSSARAFFSFFLLFYYD